jgi:CHAD domain-containing protein
VQSFLPEQYAAWEKLLKRMQDALGDMHDLDVLRAWLLQVARQESLDHPTVKEWLDRIAAERQACVERYKKAVAAHGKHADGRHLLWERWRRELEELAGVNRSDREGSSA